MHSTEIASAVRIGMAVGAGCRIEWDEVFAALYTAVPDTCAVQITGWDPVAQRYIVVAERGYPRSISHDLAHHLPSTRWGQQLFAAEPPLLMDDLPRSFRTSEHYEELLHPAGFEDGLSTALRQGGRQVGVLHMNAPVRGAFSEAAREFVTQVRPALAHGVDPLRCARVDALFGPEWAANRITAGGEVLPVTGRAGTPLIRDQRIVELAVRFGTLAVESLLFLWRQDGQWFRTAMVHVVDGNRSGVTVASTPYDNEHGLTAREVDVATGIVAGLGNQAIADGLVVSRRTVETYVERLLAKLGCASRGEVAGVAARAGLVKPAAGVGDVGDLARLTRGARGRWP